MFNFLKYKKMCECANIEVSKLLEEKQKFKNMYEEEHELVKQLIDCLNKTNYEYENYKNMAKEEFIKIKNE